MGSIVPSFIQIIADGVGLPGLSDEAAKVLAPDAEYRVREIVQDARKFMRHAKRDVLSTQDIEDALRLRNIEPVHGLGRQNRDPARFMRAAGHKDLFYLADKDVDFAKVLQAPLPEVPVEVGVALHWLAVEGRQPVIPENAPLERPRAKRQRVEGPKATPAAPAAGKAAAGLADAGEDAGGAAPVRAPVKHVLSQELQLYLDRVSQLLRAGGRLRDVLAFGAGEEAYQKAVLASLATDPGLHPLAPYLTQLIAAETAARLGSLPHLALLLGTAEALLQNPGIDMEPYVHQLLPAVVTCLVARRLGASGAEDHWAVRDRAARLLGALCRRFGDPFYNVQPRVSRTLLHALLDASMPLTTHYGAIVGLAAMGPQMVRMQLLPNLEPYVALLEREMGDVTAGPTEGAAPRPSPLRRQEAARCFGALLAASAGAMYHRITQRYWEHIIAQPDLVSKLPQLEAGGAVAASGTLDEAAPLALPAPSGTGPRSGADAEPNTRGVDDEDGKAPAEQAPDSEVDGDMDMGSDPDSKASKPLSSAGGRVNGRSRGRGGGGRRGGRGRRAAKPAASADEQPGTSSQPADSGAAAGLDAPDPGEVRSDAARSRGAGEAADGDVVMAEGASEDGDIAAADGAAGLSRRRLALPPPAAVSAARGSMPAARPQPIDSVTGVLKEAWREDSDLGQQLQALHELFGDAILPWVPFLPGAAVFV